MAAGILSLCSDGHWHQVSCGGNACAQDKRSCESSNIPACTTNETKCLEFEELAIEIDCVDEHWFPMMCQNNVCSDNKCQPVNACNDGDLGHCADLGEGIGLIEVSCKEQIWTARYCEKNEICQNNQCTLPTSMPEPEDNEQRCRDNKDNDGNGIMDCAETSCKSFDFCQEPEPDKENTLVACTDLEDNDKDGKTDCEDEDCAAFEVCQDECPEDPNKTKPGLCGCGVVDSDVDTDGDGTLDCLDECPNDILKVEPGVCGCGEVDSDVDTDGDGTSDCIDGCPEDYRKTDPGIKGCGKLDSDGSSTEGTIFHIYTAEGILDYQALSETNRNKYTKLVFHGDINLDDAGKTTTLEETCSWPDWTPIEVPNGLEIAGDNAKISYNHKNIRCTISNSLFGKMTEINMHDLMYDFDGQGNFAGLLSDEITNSVIDTIQYSGKMQGKLSSGWRFGFIGFAKGIQISNVDLEIDKVVGDIYVGGLLGEIEDGTIENKIIGLNNHINSISGNRLGVGGVIGAVSGHVYMENIYNRVGDVYASDGYAGGLTGGVGSFDGTEPEVTLKNIYNHIDWVGAYRVGGCLIGYVGRIHADNIVSYCKTRFNINSSYEGLGGFIGKIEKGDNQLTNIVNIHPGAKAGFIGTYIELEDPPVLNNIISVATKYYPCETNCIEGATLFFDKPAISCSASSNIYFYNPYMSDTSLSPFGDFSPSFSACINAYVDSEVNNVLSKLKATSPSLDWQVKNITILDKTVPVPVFTAAGALLPQ